MLLTLDSQVIQPSIHEFEIIIIIKNPKTFPGIYIVHLVDIHVITS